jgi:hypothetical protein
MSKAQKNEVVATQEQNTAVALPMDMLAELAADAKAAAAVERPAISTISLRAGIISYGGEPVKGNKLRTVIVAASHVNTLYLTKWDPDNASNPSCFSISENGENMVPHPSVISPPSKTCAACPQFQWGSDIKDGVPSKGKRCKESRRLVLLPESSLESPEDVAAAEMAVVKLPVTSVKAWGGFVNTLKATLDLPPYAVVTEISTQPDVKTQFKVLLSPVSRIDNVEALRAVMAKRKEALNVAMMPFDQDTTPADEVPAAAEKF